MAYTKIFKLIFELLVLIFFVLLLGLNLSLDTPKDRDRTFNNAVAYNKPLLIGYSSKHCRNQKENSNENTEYLLLQQFVDRYNLQAEWQEVSLHEGVDLITQGKLHILLGCFTESNHYKELVFTRPFNGKRVMALIKGENKLTVKLEKFLAEMEEGKSFENEES